MPTTPSPLSPPPPRAVVLFSGGLDSTTVVRMAQERGFAVYALSVSYGQRHHAEIGRARRLGSRMRVAEHRVVHVDAGQWGGSALTTGGSVPPARPPLPAGHLPAVPSTYVPARNTLLLALALGWAEVLGAYDLFIGANAVDFSGYPDCRPDFLSAFAAMANLATAAGRDPHTQPLQVHAPLMTMSKADIVREGVRLGVDHAATLSCYDPHGPEALACGRCEACALRRQGFAAAGLVDPAPYDVQPSPGAAQGLSTAGHGCAKQPASGVHLSPPASPR